MQPGVFKLVIFRQREENIKKKWRLLYGTRKRKIKKGDVDGCGKEM